MTPAQKHIDNLCRSMRRRLLIGRKTIESSIEAIKVFAGNDLNTDDVIVLLTPDTMDEPDD